MATLKRKDIKQKLQDKALDIPLDVLLTGKRNRNLTKKMQGFALDVATGETKAQAYRNNYNSNGKPKTQGNEGSKLAQHPEIAKEIDLITEALESAAAYTARELRGLVIGRLTQEAINMESPAASRITALKALGQVSEIAAFTERKEITQVKASEDVRSQLMAMIQGAIGDQARTVDQDANQVEIDALMNEISKAAPKEIEVSATPPEAAPDLHQIAESNTLHSNPHNQSPTESYVATLPDRNGVGGTNFEENDMDLDIEKAHPSVSKLQG